MNAVVLPALSTRIVVIVSLALNVLLAAVLASQWLHREPAPPDRTPAAIIDRIAGRLPQEDGELLRRAFEQRRDELTATHAAFRGALQRMRHELALEPLNVEALRAAADEAEQQRARMGHLFRETLLAAIPSMSPQGRMVLASLPRL